MIQKMKGVFTHLSKYGNQTLAAVCALAFAVMIPSAAHADLATTIEPKITAIVTDVTAAAGVVVLVVLAVVGAKVVYGLIKKA